SAATPTPQLHSLSLHDALPISIRRGCSRSALRKRSVHAPRERSAAPLRVPPAVRRRCASTPRSAGNETRGRMRPRSTRRPRNGGETSTNRTPRSGRGRASRATNTRQRAAAWTDADPGNPKWRGEARAGDPRTWQPVDVGTWEPEPTRGEVAGTISAARSAQNTTRELDEHEYRVDDDAHPQAPSSRESASREPSPVGAMVASRTAPHRHRGDTGTTTRRPDGGAAPRREAPPGANRPHRTASTEKDEPPGEDDDGAKRAGKGE